MSTTTYSVSGMTCNHCVAAVTDEISKLPGVQRVSVDLVANANSEVTVETAAPLDDDIVAAAIEEAGYELIGTVS